MRGTITAVAVHVRGEQYTLGCEYNGARYHVWVSRVTCQPQDNVLYKKSRPQRQDSQFGQWITEEMHRTAAATGLYKLAEDRELARKAQEEREGLAYAAGEKAKRAGPKLAATLLRALDFMRRVQAKHDPVDMPYPEIQEAENALAEAGIETHDDAGVASGDVLPEVCAKCHVRLGDQCQCKAEEVRS